MEIAAPDSSGLSNADFCWAWNFGFAIGNRQLEIGNVSFILACLTAFESLR